MSATTTIERPATAVFEPTFAELLASEEPELMREPLRRWVAVHDDDDTVHAEQLAALRVRIPVYEAQRQAAALVVVQPAA